ncbi:serine/threonine protein kinase, partial [Myxococcota bacterium]|nr:serine/threonine protein kinase [Myxococcota bacterium]
MAQSRSPVAFGPYIITRRIARGGMAEIYRARTRSTADQPSRWVAIKMMRASLGHEDLRERLFKREARIASAIDHPNVVPLYGFGQELERHYLAMEYVRGRDLSHLVKNEKRGRELLPFELVLYVGMKAAAGLGHAHRLVGDRGEPLGIVHRDISPGNVMVGYDGAVKVLDFGVARINESEGMRTQTGTLRGKFAYMSPEQTLGEALDARSDVFSLGTVLYELLTGANCFRADNPIATLERVQRVRPVPPSRARLEVPKSVDRILARCLAKDKDRRYPDCAALEAALGEFLDKWGYDGRAALVAHMREVFDWEQREEEKELVREEEEVAIFDVIDFAMVGEDGGLDAANVAVSQEEEASQSEVHKAHSLRPSAADQEVFDSDEAEA